MSRFNKERNRRERDGREIGKFSGLDVEKDKKRNFMGWDPLKKFLPPTGKRYQWKSGIIWVFPRLPFVLYSSLVVTISHLGC